jgi:hypothetical protein
LHGSDFVSIFQLRIFHEENAAKLNRVACSVQQQHRSVKRWKNNLHFSVQNTGKSRNKNFRSVKIFFLFLKAMLEIYSNNLFKNKFGESFEVLSFFSAERS